MVDLNSCSDLRDNQHIRTRIYIVRNVPLVLRILDTWTPVQRAPLNYDPKIQKKKKHPNLTSTLDDWLWQNMVIKRWASWNRTVKRISVFPTVLGEIFSRRHIWKTITSHRNKKFHASLPIIARVEQYLAKHPHTHSVTHSHASPQNWQPLIIGNPNYTGFQWLLKLLIITTSNYGVSDVSGEGGWSNYTSSQSVSQCVWFTQTVGQSVPGSYSQSVKQKPD